MDCEPTLPAEIDWPPNAGVVTYAEGDVCENALRSIPESPAVREVDGLAYLYLENPIQGYQRRRVLTLEDAASKGGGS